MARRFLVLYAVAVALLLVCAQAAGARPLVEAAEGGLVRGPRATSHQHWEHLVRRSVSRWDSDPDEYDDETADIADVRDYYRRVFADPEGWEDVREQREEMLVRLMEQLQREKAEHRTGNARANAHGYPPPWGRARVSSQEGYTKPAKDWSSEAEAIGCLRKPIRGRYIVMFQAGTSDYVLDRTIEILERANLESERRFRATDITPIRHLRKGFVATMNARTLHLMHKHPVVYSLEQDSALRHTALASDKDSESSEEPVEWNLDRIDQHLAKLDGKYNPEGTGENVDICVVDTGIRYTHSEFEGRAKYLGYDAIDEQTGSSRRGLDCHGHGSHAAATAAGKRFGVAKKATLLSARALDCSGTGAVSGIVLSMEYTVKRQKREGGGRPLVFSMSLGVKKSTSLNTAIHSVVDAGYTVVGAAGNQGSDSCDYSPASARDSISVGAMDRMDRATAFSNSGRCTDIFAPGSGILSATSTCDTCTRTLSGTSMACPHVSGFAAILLGMRPSMTPSEVKEEMTNLSTKDAIHFNSISARLASRTPNHLLFVPKAQETGAGAAGQTARVESMGEDGPR